jgi:hypothetical protein
MTSLLFFCCRAKWRWFDYAMAVVSLGLKSERNAPLSPHRREFSPKELESFA